MALKYRKRSETVKAQIVDSRQIQHICKFLEEINRPYSVALERRKGRPPAVTVFISNDEDDDNIIEATDGDLIVLKPDNELCVINHEEFYAIYEADI